MSRAATAFDQASAGYDLAFTHASIGKLQRARVWNYLDRVLPELRGRDILELNCGTGEDALRFSQLGFEVTATDASAAMVAHARQKLANRPTATTAVLDIENLDARFLQKKYDLVFSNFGGLNCLPGESLRMLFGKLPGILNKEARVILVLMPTFCLWEFAYFGLRNRWSDATRRRSDEATACLHGQSFPVWYHHPRTVCQLAGDRFQKKSVSPIGIVIPPTYLEPYFSRHGKALELLGRLEEALAFSLFAGISDHYLLDLQFR